VGRKGKGNQCENSHNQSRPEEKREKERKTRGKRTVSLRAKGKIRRRGGGTSGTRKPPGGETFDVRGKKRALQL